MRIIIQDEITKGKTMEKQDALLNQNRVSTLSVKAVEEEVKRRKENTKCNNTKSGGVRQIKKYTREIVRGIYTDIDRCYCENGRDNSSSGS
ncbi:hypothetical protein DPX39_090107300 [Trypanosoma brucei equiperdum]|uniref:Uncharacterized protein n=1 Tax=Trypanosoma brucei equiperdum TaxID=630700 RepID=A0A3L6L203_9TRYP|nr:hypothetical protein DPX39_090107300 [Trypanosoma brucei equiperdum]